MKTVIVMATALGFLLTPSLCNAKLWDTYAQCVARWGQPINSDDAEIRLLIKVPSSLTSVTFKLFSHNHIHVIIGFMHGAVCLEDFRKEYDAKITDDEFEDTLNAESDGFEWNHDSGGILWIRSDGNARAVFPPQHDSLTIDTQTFFDAFEVSLKH